MDWSDDLPGTDAGPSECLDAAYDRYRHLAAVELKALRDHWQSVKEAGRESDGASAEVKALQAGYLASACDKLLKCKRYGWDIDGIRSANTLPEYAKYARRKLNADPQATAGDAYRYAAKATADSEIEGHEEEGRVRRAFTRRGFGGNDLSVEKRRARLEKFCPVAIKLQPS